ncbi:Uu.00g054120.m01.CDS01 [Anthostomella pinea]|uniref:Uu.00g054120.m01.CDS01 n=1 Tax=Anthostomella pinea TaxID=933095 RepID=A0AAI8VWI6_9PEZI|nr:Uu.00g054120.m01.CDS01 [Anthostomella pinea]
MANSSDYKNPILVANNSPKSTRLAILNCVASSSGAFIGIVLHQKPGNASVYVRKHWPESSALCIMPHDQYVLDFHLMAVHGFVQYSADMGNEHFTSIPAHFQIIPPTFQRNQSPFATQVRLPNGICCGYRLEHTVPPLRVEYDLIHQNGEFHYNQQFSILQNHGDWLPNGLQSKPTFFIFRDRSAVWAQAASPATTDEHYYYQKAERYRILPKTLALSQPLSGLMYDVRKIRHGVHDVLAADALSYKLAHDRSIVIRSRKSPLRRRLIDTVYITVEEIRSDARDASSTRDVVNYSQTPPPQVVILVHVDVSTPRTLATPNMGDVRSRWGRVLCQHGMFNRRQQWITTTSWYSQGLQ